MYKTVNYHFTRVCNYACEFCFFTQKNNDRLNLAESLAGIQQLRDFGIEKMYVHSSFGDPPMRDPIIVDLINIEKVDDTLYMVQFDELYFDIFSNEAVAERYNYYQYNGLPKSEWPEELQSHMTNEGTNYALFKKNKYGFAMLQRSTEPIVDFVESAKTDSPEIVVKHTSEKDRYLDSLSYTQALMDDLGAAADYDEALIAAHDAWDVELNKIYGMLREKSPSAEMEQLKLEQRAWIKKRDAEAKSPEEVGVLTHWEVRLWYTKERTHDLIDLYFDEE